MFYIWRKHNPYFLDNSGVQIIIIDLISNFTYVLYKC